MFIPVMYLFKIIPMPFFTLQIGVLINSSTSNAELGLSEIWSLSVFRWNTWQDNWKQYFEIEALLTDVNIYMQNFKKIRSLWDEEAWFYIYLSHDYFESAVLFLTVLSDVSQKCRNVYLCVNFYTKYVPKSV